MPHMVAQEHMSYVEALRYGTARTEATIAAAVAAIGSTVSTLVWSNTGDGIWNIGSNITVPTNIVNFIPAGVAVNRAAGVTLTLSGGIISWRQNWETGPGTTVRGLGQGLEISPLSSTQMNIRVEGAGLTLTSPVSASRQVVLTTNQGAGSVGIELNVAGAASNWEIANSTGGTLAISRPGSSSMMLLSNTGLGLGLGMVPNALLQLIADSAFKPTTNTWSITPSNAWAKDVLEDYTEGMPFLKRLPRIVRYRYNADAGDALAGVEGIGYIAEELQHVAPAMVHSAEGEGDAPGRGQLATNIGNLFYVFVNALKELDARLTAVETH